MAFVNHYFFKDGSGVTLTDSMGTAHGTLGGAILPTWNANGYLTFVGGHGLGEGDWSRVDFTRTTFEYSFDDNYSFEIIFRSSVGVAQYYDLFNVRDYGIAGIITLSLYGSENKCYVTIQSSIAGVKQGSLPNCIDGKWHIITITYSNVANGLLNIYLDGKLVTLSLNQNIVNGDFFSTNSKTVLGTCWKNATTKYLNDFTGDICRFINCNSVLAVGEIQNMVNEFNCLL